MPDAARLAAYRRQLQRVVVRADPAVLADAEQLAQLQTVAAELGAGLGRLLGAKVPTSCCNGTGGSGAGELAVEVRLAARPTLGAEGFALAAAAGDPIYGASIRAASASGALYGGFRLLSFMQRGLPLPEEHESVPQMELRIWDLWDDIDGDVTRGFAGYGHPNKHGLSSSTMALITSDCGATRLPAQHDGPYHLGLPAPQEQPDLAARDVARSRHRRRPSPDQGPF